MLKCQSSSNKINDRGKHSKTSHSNKSLKEVKKSFDKEIPNQKQKNKFNSSNIINIKQETKHLQEIESSTFFQDCLDNKHDEIKQSDIVISVNEKEPNENKKNPM